MRKAKSALAVVIAVALVAVGGAAWALWSVGGKGNATARGGTVIELLAAGRPDPGTPLYPGAGLDLLVMVRNDNTFPVRVDRIRPGSATATADDKHRKAGCLRTGVSLSRPVYSVALDIAPDSSANVLLPAAVRMTDDSDSACQGATFTLPLTLTGRSDA
ncbi:hypothetical protein [Actinoplanes couchii]|uniref:Uncharacterized protein n=1 Tax=Actinoplanes couchii TaxID=403638 RepID=A0ABQ3X6Q2_9ACTN|nr:hypothetical protein [Actinoplanes couchii]MDR6325233.1 hypothetical protein [Actinoplanes couchii]GID54063.1 hypothetical protein Aco03nite_024670 [Actinoplanes couchii]